MTFVIRKEVVARSLDRLREQKTHTLFAGYLHLQQRAGQLGRLHDLDPDFLRFFKDFFHVDDAPLGTPYIKPFTEQKASAANLWLNENVAGSYAPSSLRAGKAFSQVVVIDGRKYSLPENHAERAFTHLLYEIPVEVADLAVFLYRDFGLAGASPTIWDLVKIFAYEFGYTTDPDALPDDGLGVLYSLAHAEQWEADWLEET